MASSSYIESLFGSLPAEQKLVLKQIFDYLLKDLRFGRPDATEPSMNFGGHFYAGTTHATPGTEFSIAHQFNAAPYYAHPVLPLDTVGAQIVPLTVSRMADTQRIYLTSTIASAPITLFLEG